MSKLVLPFTLLAILAACQEKTSSSGSSSSSPVGFTVGSTAGGSTTGGTTTSGTTGGTTTSGTTGSTGGTTTGGPSANVYSFKAIMAGGQSWSIGVVPGDIDTNQGSTAYTMGDFVALTSNNSGIFASDQRFKVKVKVLDPVSEAFVITSNNSGIRTCYGRNYPKSQQPTYNKLTLQVGIRDIYLNSGVYSLGSTYGRKTISQISRNNYSPVLDWSLGQNPGRNTGGNIVGHAIVVENVNSDSSCQWYGGTNATYCPVSAHPNTGCWGVQVELATDVTQDF
ncbi:MAG: hypothetical protein K2P81_12115 [Bacteriovoracaceae bacterium]|nr:hypothetical protein [Bacteriovoracaceae bacterium]